MASVVFYAVDIGDLGSWVGRRDRRALEAARQALREDEEADWQPQEWELLDRLLVRMVEDGQLYDGLTAEEQYYLTQLLIDLFDEFVDSEAVSEEWPLETLEEALAPALRQGGDVKRLASYLLRGRALGGEEMLAPPGRDAEEMLPYMGWVTAAELPALAAELEEVPRALRGKAVAAWKALGTACRSCVEAEQDLLSFVG
jgi:hypothetical protein